MQQWVLLELLRVLHPPRAGGRKLWGTPVLADADLCSPQSGVKLLGVKLLHLRGFPIFATSWGQTDRQTDPVSPCECQKLRTQPGRFEVSWVAWKV